MRRSGMQALARPAQRGDPALQAAVRAIVEDVRAGGWDAVVAQAERIDGAAPKLVPVAALAEEARRTLSTEQLRAINLAAQEHHRLPQGQPSGGACRRDHAGPQRPQDLARDRPGRPLYPGREDAAFLDPADARHSGAGGGREARSSPSRRPAPTAGSIRSSRSPRTCAASPRSGPSAARRPSPRSASARATSRASPRSAARAMPGSPRPRRLSPRFPAAPPSTCRPGPANCW